MLHLKHDDEQEFFFKSAQNLELVAHSLIFYLLKAKALGVAKGCETCDLCSLLPAIQI